MSLSEESKQLIQYKIDQLKFSLKFSHENITRYEKQIAELESDIPDLQKQIANLEKDLEK